MPFTLAGLEQAIRACWSRDTSEDPAEWGAHNRSRGQCGATALLIHDLLGGEILLADVLRDGKAVERHAWNRLPSGVELDLTRDQFRRGETVGRPRPGESLVRTHAGERCERLAARVKTRLGVPAV